MNYLDQIIIENALTSKEHPDALGEILRAWAFVGKGYGCYSNFDVRPDAVPAEVTPREFALLWGREYEGDDTSPNSWGYCDVEAMKEIRWFKHPSGIEFGWHWDGDGTLAFYVPELADEYHNGVVLNRDCKKDYEWQFQEHLRSRSKRRPSKIGAVE